MKQTNETYHKTVAPALVKEFGLKSVMAAPKLVKVVVNCSMGEALKDKKTLESMRAQLAVITGQRPSVQKARVSISTFKLREGEPIGLKVTLRGTRMYDFITKLTTIALPRVRDFRGVPRKGFDGQGNYTLGVREQTIFPELEYTMVDRIRGFEITFVTTAGSDREAMRLLELLDVPFEKESN